MNTNALRQRAHRLATMLVVAAAISGCRQFDEFMAKRAPAADAGTPSALAGGKRPSKRKSSPPSPEATFARARSLEKSGDLERAAEAYHELVKKHADYGPAYHRLAVVHEKLGKRGLAEKYYRSALLHNPDDPELLCDFGYSLYLRGQYAAAEDQLSLALSQAPNHARTNLHLGLVQACTNRKDEALESFAAAGCAPAEAHANLAYGLMAQDDWSEAAAQLQVANAHDPKSKRLKDRLAEAQAILARKDRAVAQAGFAAEGSQTGAATARISDRDEP